MDQTTGSTEPDTEAHDDRSFYEFLTRVGAIDRGGETLTELPVEPVELEAIGLEPGLQPEPGLPRSEPTAPRPSLFARIPKGKMALATVTVLAVMIPTVGLINARGKV